MDTVCRTLSTGISALAEWLQERGLLINKSKTQVMYISPRGLPAEPLPTVRCLGEPLSTVSVAQYLGVHIDNDLSWSSQIDVLSKQISRSVGMVWQIRATLTLQTKRLCYFAFIQAKLCYASNAYFPSVSQTSRSILDKLSCRAIRASLGCPAGEMPRPYTAF